ncbi:OmpP1/FadL family transporter [Desulforhopalus sp. 52FAK]
MNRNQCVMLSTAGMCFMFSTFAYGSGIVNKQGYSADYYRTLNRAAATEGVDVAAYNPAGVMKLVNGIHVRGEIQYVGKTYTNTVPGYGDLESDEPSVIPGLFSVYKQDKWAGYFAITFPGGGGRVDYENGNARTAAIAGELISSGMAATISNMSLNAMTTYTGFTLGGAYAVNDTLSLSLGMRYIYAYQEFEGIIGSTGAAGDTVIKLDLERDATGVGGILGVNISPSENLNIGMRLESSTKIDFESSVARDDLGLTSRMGMGDGVKQREDLPGLISVGLSYKPAPSWRLETSFTYYLEDDATWEDARLQGAGNSWEAGLAIEYKTSPKLLVSAGYLYNELEIGADEMQPENPLLDNHSIGAGGVWSVNEKMNVSLGIFNTFYDDETTSSGVTYKKDALCAALGVEYMF